MTVGGQARTDFKKKGGTVFPRIPLGQAVQFSEKLVSKTHTGPQPRDTLFKGVFGAASTRADARASALKQFGLMEGNNTTGYKATDLAINLAAAPVDEKAALLREACVRPKVFKLLFDTYHGDTVTAAKLKQQSASAKVHPEEQENCADNFIQSALTAGLASREGDLIRLIPADAGTSIRDPDTPQASQHAPASTDAESLHNFSEDGVNPSAHHPASARSVIHVNVTLDSSLDTDKLERQLTLLRRFGAI